MFSMIAYWRYAPLLLTFLAVDNVICIQLPASLESTPVCKNWSHGTTIDLWSDAGEGMIRRTLTRSSHDSSLPPRAFVAQEIILYGQMLSDASKTISDKLNSKTAYVTMATLCASTSGTKSGFYLERALTLARSLRAVESRSPLLVLIADQSDCELAQMYEDFYSESLNVHFFRPSAELLNIALPHPEPENWQYTYPKVDLWAMEGFDRLVFVDGDVMVLKNMDDLFDLPASKMYMSTDQQACQRSDFDDNNYGAASNLVVLSPNLTSFQTVRKTLYDLGLANSGDDDQLIISRLFQEKLENLPRGRMLYMECFLKFDCNMDEVRAIHLGYAGRFIFENRTVPTQFQSDPVKSSAFQDYAKLCEHEHVKEACKNNCPCSYSSFESRFTMRQKLSKWLPWHKE
eukprot:TRINITY_DN14944_c0_g4_i1.p1 TRINITY_DN14944_c0_g4~~TRINITY_DN14944_c0_g4_i1.p1  ORF type:complete len:402 (-),score=79.13 TRINITY_DN14944_c0_g4_i1:291-1496(-)